MMYGWRDYAEGPPLMGARSSGSLCSCSLPAAFLPRAAEEVAVYAPSSSFWTRSGELNQGFPTADAETVIWLLYEDRNLEVGEGAVWACWELRRLCVGKHRMW